MSEKAIFAGGCFWCMIQPFDTQPGIHSVTSGYTGGHVENPTYEQVLSHTTGHTEAVEIEYDPAIMPYEKLVEIYWQQTDPTDALGQFEDRGDNYRPVIFYTNDEQKQIAEKSRNALQTSGRFNEPIVTTIEPAVAFYPAEEYHQDFYQKDPKRYEEAHLNRANFIEENW
ncbi:peptide methionine sulfoxide reductase msrA [Enterococcus moraviensis ATCC BAA-383]|uniref:Peptide methionine sulfoxide reductase MsrA n=1 Tax=Enterococcus moraviensis ATCC BAA-383 TaxID=1158609 RepID=R2QYF0_9ENTE|nr:peptide-methionine (S)-S-oxide reductase MsrA [Enterococcus moraviensis]EOI00426.1 peptide methionine sulfoxide reductase msrA [Enterococcus moraviensis ATCC BAA-383]EOT73345.1 peptide methionine sulfoxide reductase msrA [Enterococcus moraviensis ATCC BAA-383]OJG68902.1 peptide methionine sulfoxide reductase msrA [Enterococcus moraviensis]